MIIHCPSCRCEIKTKKLGIAFPTSNFDVIPIQELLICIRCNSKFIIVEWKEKI